jgi:hypothetical protein
MDHEWWSVKWASGSNSQQPRRRTKQPGISPRPLAATLNAKAQPRWLRNPSFSITRWQPTAFGHPASLPLCPENYLSREASH